MTPIDVNTIVAQIAHMVKACIEAGRDQVQMSIAEIRVRAPEFGDIAGLREQITANALFILPSIHPSAFAIKGNHHFEPKIYVVVSGVVPNIRAYLMYGYDATPTKTRLAFGDFADTEAGALHKLLRVTMHLVNDHKEQVVAGDREICLDKEGNTFGGYYLDSAVKLTPEQRDHEKAWGSRVKIAPNLNASARTGFASTVDDDQETAVPFGTTDTTPKHVNFRRSFEDISTHPVACGCARCIYNRNIRRGGFAEMSAFNMTYGYNSSEENLAGN